ncbi:hypothetical protein J3E68DRAFT_390656 [Trichoderma sp. SZMC 28012]
MRHGAGAMRGDFLLVLGFRIMGMLYGNWLDFCFLYFYLFFLLLLLLLYFVFKITAGISYLSV